MGCCYSDQQMQNKDGQFNNCLQGGHTNATQFQMRNENGMLPNESDQSMSMQQQYIHYKNEYNRRKSGQHRTGIATGGLGPELVVSSRMDGGGEGNSGGTGQGMQIQNHQSASTYRIEASGLQTVGNFQQASDYPYIPASGLQAPQQMSASQNNVVNQSELISPMNIDEPIEGVLISEEEKKIAPLLQLEILEGQESMMGQKLIINAQGLVASKRKKKDGCTIIGSQDSNAQTGEHYNDIVIQNELEMSNNGEEGAETPNQQLASANNNNNLGGIGKRHMVIKYSIDDKRYYLRDLGDGSGTFIRVDNRKDLILKHGFIVSYGDSHMVVQFSGDIHPETHAVIQKITLKFLDGPKIDKSFTFTTNECKSIKIGRMSQCQIKFDDNSLSRLQCQINYETFDPDNVDQYYNGVNADGSTLAAGTGIWVLRDGDPDSGKKSTNGTWLFVDELFPICDQLIFKAGQTLFQSSMFQPQTDDAQYIQKI